MGAIERNENVTKLNTENKLIYDQLQSFIKMNKRNSENTATEYQRDIKKFFRITKFKEIEHLSIEDVQITLDDFELFIEEVYDNEGLNGKTVNRNIASIRSFLNYLHTKKINGKRIVEDVSYFKFIQKCPETNNSHGILTVDEVEEIARLILVKPRVRDREIKYFLVLFAMDTAIRRTALLNLKWTDFEVKNDETVLIKALDKGNKDYRPSISLKRYNDLLTIKGESEKVFPISKNAVQSLMDRVRVWMNFPPERNIVFHSIRKAGVTFQWKRTNNLNITRKFANHSSPNATLLYIEDDDEKFLGAWSSKDEIDDCLYKNVSHEELIKGIENLNKDQILLLNLKLNEIINKNE
ncbi:tyrosine-type recombinase/integrase [Heyndrickxia camelliae]|nr:site-specific integrase [Heyndrickxia camelliae]